MKHSFLKLTSVLLTAVMLLGVLAAAPFTASAEDNGLTVIATSNLFEESQTTVTSWTNYENKQKEVYVAVEYTIRATDKYLIGLELDKLTWDPAVLEYKESYNMVKVGRNEVLNLFPFAVSQGCGAGTYNTFGDNNGGKLVGNYSSVSPAAYASEEDESAVVAVKAIFRVLNRDAGSTTVNCSVETLSLSDITNTHPYVQYLPVNRGIKNRNANNWAEYGSSAAPIYPKPYLRGKSLTVAGGEVNINFYLYIKDPDYDVSRLKATFVWGEGNYHTEKESTDLKQDRTGNYFVCNVGAPCMNDKITFTLFEDSIELFNTQYAVTDYAVSAKKQAALTGNRKLMQLICDLLDYGGAAQQHFGYRTNAPASDFISELNTDQTALGGNWTHTVREENLPNETNMKELDNTVYGIKYAAYTINLDAKISIKVFFDKNSSDDLFANTHAYLGDEELTFNDYNSTRVYLEITDIKPDKLFAPNTITFENGANSTQKIYSAAAYFNTVKNKDAYSPELKYLLQAMNNYANSTADYIS